MWYEHKFFKYSVGAILVLLIIFLLGKVDFFLEPFKKFVAILFFPILVSGLLYYLLRPLIRLVQKVHIPKTKVYIPKIIAILIVFLTVVLFIAGISSYTGSLIGKQINQLAIDIPQFIEISKEKTTEFINSKDLSFIPVDQISQQFTSILQKVIPMISQSVFSGLSAVTSIATVLLVIPFILFYLLKDDTIFVSYFMDIIPEKHRRDSEDILKDVDKTLSTYIIGQATIALAIGILMYAGFMILGLKYALILALFAMFTAIIPVLGAFIGILPALLVGLADSPITSVKVLVLMIIVQQLEGNLLSPQIMGKRMRIHPLTLIFLLIVSAALYGFIGMLIAVPTYAVLKIIIKNVIKAYRLRKA